MATSALFNVIISSKDKAVLETLNTPCRIFLPSREVSKQRGSQKQNCIWSFIVTMTY